MMRTKDYIASDDIGWKLLLQQPVVMLFLLLSQWGIVFSRLKGMESSYSSSLGCILSLFILTESPRQTISAETGLLVSGLQHHQLPDRSLKWLCDYYRVIEMGYNMKSRNTHHTAAEFDRISIPVRSTWDVKERSTRCWHRDNWCLANNSAFTPIRSRQDLRRFDWWVMPVNVWFPTSELKSEE